MDENQIEELRFGIARLARRMRFERADDQLGDTQTLALMFVARLGAKSLRELSEHARVTPPSMNETVNSLIASGYLVRRKDPSDLRKVLFVPTEAGLAWARETSRRRHGWLSQRIGQLSKAEQQALVRATPLLQRLASE